MRSFQTRVQCVLASLLCVVACSSDAEPIGASGASGEAGQAGEGGSAGAAQGGTSGVGGEGGTSSAGSAGSAGGPDTPPTSSSDFCERIAPGPPGERAFAVDLSAAHASIRFFGTETSHAKVDAALLSALDTDAPWSASSLGVYAAALDDVCFLKATDRTLLDVSVQSMGTVALIRPGKGKPLLPVGTTAVAVDLRDLPTVEGLREAIEDAVGLALAEPVPRRKLGLREHTGMTDEIFVPMKLAPGAAYSNTVINAKQAPVPAGASSQLPLILLTGPRLAPAAAEIAATLRLAGVAWLAGDDVLAAVAEAQWFGVGDHGLAHRDRVLGSPNLIPDVIPADISTLHPEQHLDELAIAGQPTPFVAASGERKRIESFPTEASIESGAPERATARAALTVAHGAARTFFPYFSVVGDTLDDALIGELSAIDAAPVGSFSPRPFLQRLSWHLHDSHSWAYYFTDPADPPSTAGYVPLALDSGAAGEAIVRRSALAGVERGEVVVAIGGKPMAEVLAAHIPQLSSSTAGAATRDALARAMVATTDVNLELRAPNGVTHTVLVDASSLLKSNPASVVSSRKAGPLSDLGASDVYYVNLDASALTDSDHASTIVAAASGAQGLVIDARGYPGSLEAWELIRRIIKTSSTIKLNVDVITTLGRKKTAIDQPWIAQSAAPRYDGKVVVLIGPSTQSQAEHILIPLVNEKRATFLGRRSAGADGNITGVMLPGRQGMSFTGMEVLFQDGSTFHGQGIAPDVHLVPTPAQLASDPDPELSAAITLLK